ncbi:Acetate kinase [Serratia marcescens]|uniref:Acetate kinase n=1 Tax=Serratia marcescens TaxID=615 RepID=A0A379Z065_SERMA|nr:Acetate kinase [Serratia marcescens]
MSSKLVLVLNCGSSSLKFAIIDAVNGDEFLSGLAECFHLPEARIKWKMDGAKHEAALGAGAAHSEALNFIVNTILAQKPELSAQLTAIGHRIVHGGEKFTASAVINDEVLQGIKDSVPFAPLHNPAHLIGIAEALKSFPHLADKNVAVFDTAFHQNHAGRILPVRPAVQPVPRPRRSPLRRTRHQPLLRDSGSREDAEQAGGRT